MVSIWQSICVLVGRHGKVSCRDNQRSLYVYMKVVSVLICNLWLATPNVFWQLIHNVTVSFLQHSNSSFNMLKIWQSCYVWIEICSRSFESWLVQLYFQQVITVQATIGVPSLVFVFCYINSQNVTATRSEIVVFAINYSYWSLWALSVKYCLTNWKLGNSLEVVV